MEYKQFELKYFSPPGYNVNWELFISFSFDEKFSCCLWFLVVKFSISDLWLDLYYWMIKYKIEVKQEQKGMEKRAKVTFWSSIKLVQRYKKGKHMCFFFFLLFLLLLMIPYLLYGCCMPFPFPRLYKEKRSEKSVKIVAHV